MPIGRILRLILTWRLASIKPAAGNFCHKMVCTFTNLTHVVCWWPVADLSGATLNNLFNLSPSFHDFLFCIQIQVFTAAYSLKYNAPFSLKLWILESNKVDFPALANGVWWRVMSERPQCLLRWCCRSTFCLQNDFFFFISSCCIYTPVFISVVLQVFLFYPFRVLWISFPYITTPVL